jgi:uncharacterized protein (DUF58 family)
MSDYLIFLVILFVIAALLGGDFIFKVLYLFMGVYILGRWWSRRAIRNLKFTRRFSNRAFIGEDVNVTLKVSNLNWLPVVWLRINESIPVNLGSPDSIQKVISLGPNSEESHNYVLRARKRGYYPIGPLFASTGDLLGLEGENKIQAKPDYLTVYPRIIQFTNIKIPSNSPLGSLRHKQPIFEDPTRIIGKRDYVDGDSLRRVDWKSTAVTGRLQVKQFEPSIALETAIFLNVNLDEYHQRQRVDSTELAIILAASIANWITTQKQAVGLVTNGVDPLSEGRNFKAVPTKGGRGHLMRILDVLARVKPVESTPFIELLQRESVFLPWGTSLILITGNADEQLFDKVFRIRQSGLHVFLIAVGLIVNVKNIKIRADHFKIPFYHVRNELDIDQWRI